MIVGRIYSSICISLILIWSCSVSAETKTTTQGPLISEPVGAGDFLQMFVGLLFVLGIIFGMAWFIRRMGTFQQVSHGALRIVASLSIGQRERIVLVQVGEKQLLIGIAPGQIRTLHELEESVVIGQQKTNAGISFAERLQSVIQGKGKQ